LLRIQDLQTRADRVLAKVDVDPAPQFLVRSPPQNPYQQPVSPLKLPIPGKTCRSLGCSPSLVEKNETIPGIAGEIVSKTSARHYKYRRHTHLPYSAQFSPFIYLKQFAKSEN
jgi:hypothetical protein